MYDVIATLYYNYKCSYSTVDEYTVYGAKFNGHLVTFYKTTITFDYICEVVDHLPQRTKLKVTRYPDESLNLFNPRDRKTIIKTLVAIRTHMQR